MTGAVIRAGRTDVDVAVVGDGPAGASLAAACRARGLAVVVVAPGEPWPATYGAWLDDVAGAEVLGDLGERTWASTSEHVVVHGDRRHELARPYGVLANDAVRAHLLAGVDLLPERAVGAQQFTWGTRALTANGALDAVVVVDATGAGGTLLDAPARPPSPAWQTAYGIVVESVPADAAVEVGATTLMDFRPPPGPDDDGLAVPTFCYVVPAGDGWLVEETVLAARPAVDPDLLRSRLVRRLGADGESLVAAADDGGCVEQVRIPMGGRLPSREQPVVAFGAAAGLTHPATGYSVAASIRAAPRVAEALVQAIDVARDGGPVATRAVWDAVLPRAQRRSRALHDYGAEVLTTLDGAMLRAFFDAFFERPVAEWAAYLRVDATPGELARVMRSVFVAAPRQLRRRLATGDPRAWARLVRP